MSERAKNYVDSIHLLIDPPAQREILRYLRQRVAGADHPGRYGRALRGARHGLWRYRIGAYRLICKVRQR
jgi:mRNA interferase RelE/StbE